MGKYDSPGKQAFRDLLLELMRRDGLRTYGTFWGEGEDSRQFAAAGFDVTACDNDTSLHEAMRLDGEQHGYQTFAGNARRLEQRFDMFHADFCGTASPENFRTLRAISEKVDKWLAVTLAPDHQLDPSMQGEAALATVPAWLTFASGQPLRYLGRYVRNDGGQTMWCALMQASGASRKVAYVSPATIHWSIGKRGYWASDVFYDAARGLLPHFTPQLTPHLLERRRQWSLRWWANRSPEQKDRKREQNARYRREKGLGGLRLVCGAMTVSGMPCRKWADASGRCRHHRGLAA